MFQSADRRLRSAARRGKIEAAGLELEDFSREISPLKTMVDLHCHILPGLDDGPETIEESIAMAESAMAEGTTHVVATPHADSTYVFDYLRVSALRDELQARIGSGLILATGCDFHLNPENLQALYANAPRFCINQKDYLLVEFNEFSIPPAMDHTLHELQLAGLRPVITHPERNAILRAQADRLAKWVRHGCYVQITGGALTGAFGMGAQKDALRWIEAGIVHFVASDAHSAHRRPLKLLPAYTAVRERFGEDLAQALFTENPLAAFEGRQLPHISELDSGTQPSRRKRFLFF